MLCRTHPEREALAVCQKHETGYCRECCECLKAVQCCECVDPSIYCKFRTQCLIWELSRDRRRSRVRKAEGAADSAVQTLRKRREND